MAKADPLADEMEQYACDPVGFVRDAYPWGADQLAKHTGPRQWQSEILQDIGDHLSNPETRCTPLRLAVASGHGVGKSAVIGMIVGWAMSTCPETRIVVTANTDTQLKTKTWPEIGKWARMLINADWWRIPASSMYEVSHEKSWRADAIPWSENNTEAFAGLHNEGKRIILIFDEASPIADKVWEVAEGALTDQDTEIIWIAFGNPTRNTGRFRECFGKYRHLWKTRQIDSRTVEGTNKAYLDELVETYGEESDIVKVRVRGQFPSQSVSQFIATDLVEAAQLRKIEVFDHGAPLILGVDIARFGDDKSVIRGRVGRNGKPFPPIEWNGLDTVKSAERVADAIQKYNPDGVFIDGGGIGGAVVDILKSWDYKVQEINFGEKASNERDYANKRAEMWAGIRDWLPTASIDDSMTLRDDLIGPDYMLDKNGRILLEKKEDMKARGLASPDHGDALCFVAGTLVSTPDGRVPIELLRVGDEVLTPFGTSRVAITYETPAASITTAVFSDGSKLSGKGDHKIFTFNRGMQRIDTLQLTDAVDTDSIRSRFLWRLVSLCCIGVRSFGFKRLAGTFSPDARSLRRDFCIAGFGLTRLALSRSASMFITKMAIGATTPYQILSWSMRESTSGLTCLSGWLGRRSSSKIKNGSEWLEKKPQSGTDRQRGESGTSPTGSIHGQTGKYLLQHARDAAPVLRHTGPLRLDSALEPACKPFLSGRISRALGSAASAGRNLWQTVTGQQPIVPVSVQTESAQGTLTYNLTLEKDNAYYANGILAFNCLTFARPVQRKGTRTSRDLANRPRAAATDYKVLG